MVIVDTLTDAVSSVPDDPATHLEPIESTVSKDIDAGIADLSMEAVLGADCPADAVPLAEVGLFAV